MSFRFVSASSQRFINDANNPITTTPFTIGCWVRPTSVTGLQTVWSIANTAVTNSYWRLQRNSATNWQFSSAGGGTGIIISVGVPVIDRWSFIICRAITATNRRIHVLDTSPGTHANAQTTTSRTPTSINIMALGVFNGSSISAYWDGDIAEFWYTNTDIYADGTALPESLFRQLAYYGPFSDTRTQKDLIEYRSFRTMASVRRSSGTIRGGIETYGDEIYYGGSTPTVPAAIRVWDNLGGDNARIASHPPAADRNLYLTPANIKRPTMILV
jgi:hypothetical protein